VVQHESIDTREPLARPACDGNDAERRGAESTRPQALIVGGDDVSYGKRPVGVANLRDKMLSEVKLVISWC
jgi:hypothetical protein